MENPIWTNILGESFYDTPNGILYINPETGDKELLDLTLQDLKINPYWNAIKLQREWESSNGPLPENKYLLPITPFVLGGKFEASNLMAISKDESMTYYENLREKIKDSSIISLTFVW